MKNFCKTQWNLGFLLVFSAMALAQSKDKQTKPDNEAFENLEYINAIDIYTRVAERGEGDEKLIHRLATANYFNRDFKAAAKWYNTYYNMPSARPSLLDNFYYGQILKTQKEYKKADSLLLSYYNYKGIRYTSLANPKEDPMAINNDSVFELRPYNYNTKRSEYPAFIKNNELYVVGYGLNKKKREGSAGLTSDIYKASANGEFVHLSEFINSEYNEGPLAITNDGKTMYFSRNAFLNGRIERNKNNIVTINIYIAKFKQGKWKDVKAFPFNSIEFSVGHPALSKDNKTLYYASNIPGGKGGTDIYSVSIKDDGTFGKPKNLEAINTIGNEMFPFIDPYDESLYFASNGPESIGGLDVFISKKNPDNEYKRSYNLGEQINTTSDDFSFMIGADRIGYFASNKNYDKSIDDIYSFKALKDFEVIPYINFKGIARNFDTDEPLANVKLTLHDANGNIVASTITDDNGYYEFGELDARNVAYVRAEKDNFQTSEKNITKAMRNGKEPLDIRLVYLGISVPEEIVITGKIQDNKTDEVLKNVSVKALDIDGNILEMTTTKWYGYYTLENLKSDKVAFLKIEKDGYQTEEVPVNIKDVDAQGNLKIDVKMVKNNVPLELNNDIAAILNPIYFEYAKSDILPASKIELDKVVAVLNKFKSIKIRIESYTDSRGRDITNIKLSHARARSTYDYLISKGISPERLEYYGFGELGILNHCTNGVPCTEAEHRINRRSTFRIIKL
ncbi:carboxypeptidase regulatory-like domain-containing protein [Gaetbulibacter aestuarii]|uniref:Carboxypeptidase regulatory-like domain-containing protein n=1 Tax=Gaetbulibacter aestuarii TaxID=1502358 RepID=A0ABW7MTY3_9FLAO